jgi:predicted nucleotide-binding protein
VAIVNQELLEKLVDKTGLSKPRVYALIAEKVRATHLPRRLAAIALASERGINPSRFATEEDFATIRGVDHAALAPLPATPAARPVAARAPRAAPGRKRPSRRTNEVFIVHGRNERILREVKGVLRALGLTPVDFPQALKRTKKGSPLISEVLDAVLKKDQPVLVLLTPDDQAQLDPKLRKPGEPAHEKKLKGQARPNVLFEAGMAFGRSPDTTVLVEVGKIRPFSDVAGRHAVRLNNTTASRVDLATKLENAGCEVDRTADEEGWLTAGDFRI